jgi:SLT domain-containing protein
VATWGLNNVLAIANTLLVLPWVLLWTKVLRDPATAMFRWLLGTVTAGFKAVTVAIDNLFVKPWVLIWSKGIREPVSAAQEWLRSSVFEPLGKAFATYVTEPITNAWRAVTEFMPRAMQTVADFVQGLWTSMVGSIQNAVRGMFTFIATAANRVRSLVNVLISAYNRLASAVGGTQLALVGEITVPAFAQGGVVSRPTLAMVGEGGEREYIIPESKMQAASSRFLAGQRGAGVVPSGSSPSASTTSAPQINITTGPVMQQQDGSRWVSIADFERGLQQVAEQMVGTLRTPQARTALGWS